MKMPSNILPCEEWGCMVHPFHCRILTFCEGAVLVEQQKNVEKNSSVVQKFSNTFIC